MAEFYLHVEGDLWGFEVTLEYEVSGSYVPGGLEEPPEDPDVEIECYRMPKDLAALLGISEVLDSDRVEAHIDMGRLYDALLVAWADEIG